MIETSIYVGDLRSRLGSRRDVHLEIPGDDYQSFLCKVIDTVVCDFTLESVTSGIVIHGLIQGNFGAQCSYGLREIVQPFTVNVNELFEEIRIRDRDDLDEETYKFKGDDLDISQMLTDAIVPSLPLAPVCSGGPSNCVICSAQIKPFISDQEHQSRKFSKDSLFETESDDIFDPRWDALRQLSTEKEIDEE